ncbi:hypothetical protein [Ponticoccus alexandrii]|uniref:DUF4760 domain-containing protein n=1 Tax=Ponticoccus alexandrii TaxID=1943633 RepID=A0ABX7F5W0_9RHOB|nr:hypothetical protein [Ponticoccus alexandrii]QRF65504.1 hypothetical protein GQA70_03730 [Ponticoccus alexandrii]
MLIGLIVAIVGYFLQQRAWRQKNIEEVRRLEFEECLKLIDEIGRAIDERLMQTSRYAEIVRKCEKNSKVESEFQESIEGWMGAFSSRKSKIYHYYGREAMIEFENVVHSQMREVSEILKREGRLGLANLSSKHRKESRAASARIDFARHSSFKFLRELNERLSNGDVGRTSLVNNIRDGALDNISKVYLLKRMFAINS